jgi:hypothetical protein
MLMQRMNKRVSMQSKLFSQLSIAALLALVWVGYAQAQSPLTVQPSTNRVGVNTTNPSTALEVTGTVKATAFQGDGSQLTNVAGKD